jgi:hypothetical protein
VYAALSRFVPNAIAGRFESCAWPVAEAAAGSRAEAREGAPRVDLAARIRAQWGSK